MTTQHREEIAAEMRAAAARADMSLTEISDRSGLSRATLSKTLNAQRPVQVEELIAFAAATGAKVSDLIPKPAEVAGSAA